MSLTESDKAALARIAKERKQREQEQAKRIADKYIAPNGGKPKPVEADAEIKRLAKLSTIDYERERKDAAEKIGIDRVSVLDKLVRQLGAKSENEAAALPHWNVEPWPAHVSGAALLADIAQVFTRYIVLPKGASDALALWTLHAWTMDAGDISPFLVLVSPTKRCGKTSVLIILLYLTPRSELASNISASAIFRYVEDIRPTLLIDEADTFVKGNEEMRGILDSGHTRAAAHVIRNVEVNGEHKPRRFSTWAPKAIATIQALADTLEDRSIVLLLQRKPKAAKVARLRRRDNQEFTTLRRQAARWAADNFDKLLDPEPSIPDALNDRAADNWRPLLAVAELAGEAWAKRAREAACILSGDGHDTAVNVELLADIKAAFGDASEIRSADLVAALIANPERPWIEWKNDKPLTQKQLGGLLRPFEIVSETVHIKDLKDAKGYKRCHFEAAWECYLPAGQNDAARQGDTSEASNRPSADETGTSGHFSKRPENNLDGSKNANLSHSRSDLDAWTDKNPVLGPHTDLTTNNPPTGNGQAPPDIDIISGEPPGRMACNGYAISATPEDRQEPQPGQLACRVYVREVRHPKIKSGPDDNLDDFVAF